MEPEKKEEEPVLLSISDELSVERTLLANDRTLLSFVRTSLYFSIAGLTITNLLDFSYEWLFSTSMVIIAIVLMTRGIYRYFKLSRKLKRGIFDKSHFRFIYHDED